MPNITTNGAVVVDHAALNTALNRFRFRNPFHEDTLFPHLSKHDQKTIVWEALEIQKEKIR